MRSAKHLSLHPRRGPRGEAKQVLEVRAVARGSIGGQRLGPLHPSRLGLRPHGAEHQALEADRLPREAAKKLGLGVTRAARLDGEGEEDAALGRVDDLVLDGPGVEDFGRGLRRRSEGGVADRAWTCRCRCRRSCGL